MADRQIDAIIAGLDRFVEQEMIALTLDVTATLIETTPVDIGWARAGWVPSLAAPYLGPDITPTPGAVQAALGRQAAGQAGVFRYTLDVGPIFVSNNVQYIGVLNGGSSTQAPAGFVQQAIVKAVRRRSR